MKRNKIGTRKAQLCGLCSYWVEGECQKRHEPRMEDEAACNLSRLNGVEIAMTGLAKNGGIDG